MKVLKFGAVWCKECLVMRPMWEEIEKEIPNLQTEYFDADENPDLLKKYDLRILPSFVFLDKNNQIIITLKGIQNKEDLLRYINDNISK
jgi:thiol-disulfide isomerase/thioredoxin